jgi:amidase
MSGCGTASQDNASRTGTKQADRFRLNELSIGDLQKSMDEGSLTSREITQLYLDRIDTLDRQGPALRSIIEVNPEALEIAGQLDRERKDGKKRGALHGIPIILKDNIDTADRMTTTAGSLALEGSVPAQDSFVARQLRDAGAVLLAKANLSEWANFRSDYSSSGWSARGGQCRNPYALDRNPCGSSSGSAVATSANLCAGSIGTETNGSIVCPSNANGVVGLKPTLGLVSRSGIIPIAHSQDTAGPITRTVADAAAILSAIAGVDPRDAATAAGEGQAAQDYTAALKRGSLKGARVGVVRQSFGFLPAVDRLMEDAIRVLKELGAEIVDPADIPTNRQFGRPSFQVLLYEFKADLNAYLAGLGEKAPVHSLEELIRFNDEHAENEMPFFGQELFIQAEAKGPLTSQEYLDALALAKKLAGVDGIDKVMDDNKLDVLVAPTGGPAWKTDHINGDHGLGGSSSPAAVAGYPNITVPAGFVSGLPVGLSFFGRAWTEAKLIGYAFDFEQESRLRLPPEFLPSLEEV